MKQENKHKAIIVAATKVFAKKGFFNARISDIAKEAKVADGTIYLYFNNKNDILASVFDEEISKIVIKTKKQTAKTDNPLEMLRILINQHLLTMKKNRNLAEIIHTELRQVSKTIGEYQPQSFADYEAMINEVIIQGQNEGIFLASVNPDITRRIILGSLDELSRVWSANYETHYSVDELAAQLFTTLTAGICVKKG